MTIQRRGMTENGNLTYLPYNAKAPVIEPNLRTIKVMYKKPKDGSKQKDNVCLLVDPVTEAEVKPFLPALMPHIIAMCETTQDAIAKELHTSNDTLIEPTQLDMESIVSKLERDAISQRINKETINSWFDSNMADVMSVLFADKLGLSENPTQEDSDKVDRFVSVYRNKFAGLASNMTAYQPNEAEKLVEAMEKCEIAETDLLAAKLKDKLVKMQNPVDTMELLGF